MSRNLLPLSLTAALLAGTAMADTPGVAADIAPVHSLVARVMAGVGEPELIVAPGASPHEYSLRPSEAQALQDAALVFWIGPDLTPWLGDSIETLAGGAEIVTLSALDGTTTLPTRDSALFEAHSHDGDHDHEEAHDAGHDHEEAHDHDHDHDDHAGEDGEDHDHDQHAEGEAHDHDHDHEHADRHDHAGTDPHMWLSTDNASAWLTVIADSLSAADPENAEAYAANAAAGREELAALSQDIEEMLAPVQGQNFIVFHDAYQYFENSFGIPASGAISLSDAADPSPARIAEVQGRVQEQQVTCVLSEPQFSPGVVAAVMEGSEARTGVLDPLGSDLEPGSDLYPQLLRNLAGSLADCLQAG
ncbi:zinc ABC transporter substrate-binding protein [Roseovarius sp.]|uniref:zinc ABC transporter substrate-binding protein n=1 Tax=Roseovarius sp. TaxID=1486281 RepID=UPI0026191C26|nr:zinc ABC transporter substrate-binding protein [Roseovarius sp.]MDM8165192.1 zinc ABC transporter substrate-binding protein [Roseovarius sp.]